MASWAGHALGCGCTALLAPRLLKAAFSEAALNVAAALDGPGPLMAGLQERCRA